MVRSKCDLNDPAGFSLVEVLFAVGIFAAGMLGIVSLYYSTSSSLRQASNLTEAVFVGQDALSQTLETPFLDMRSESYAQGAYNIDIDIAPNPPKTANPNASPPDSGLATITVTVTWPRVLGMVTDQYTLEYIRAETRSSKI